MWYVLTVSGLLYYFNSKKEAEQYIKGFPAGTYKLAEC